MNGGERCEVINISALKAITEEQVLKLNELGIADGAISVSQKIDDEDSRGEIRGSVCDTQ